MGLDVQLPSQARLDPARLRTRLFIDGQWVDAADGGELDVIDPHDGSTITRVAEARAVDVDRAVDAAERAFPAWSATAPAERGRILLLLADLVEDNLAERPGSRPSTPDTRFATQAGSMFRGRLRGTGISGEWPTSTKGR